MELPVFFFLIKAIVNYGAPCFAVPSCVRPHFNWRSTAFETLYLFFWLVVNPSFISFIGQCLCWKRAYMNNVGPLGSYMTRRLAFKSTWELAHLGGLGSSAIHGFIFSIGETILRNSHAILDSKNAYHKRYGVIMREQFREVCGGIARELLCLVWLPLKLKWDRRRLSTVMK